MRRLFLNRILILFFAALLAACGGAEKDKGMLTRGVWLTGLSKEGAERRPVPPVTRNAPDAAARPVSDYVLGPEDLIDVVVFQVDELKTETRVSATGEIGLPLAGRITASGKTVRELEAEISRRLRPYIEDPIVSIFVREYRSQRISVLGAVRNPHTYTVFGQKYLLDMISEAGGLTEDASSLCYIQKVGTSGEALLVDLKQLLVNGRMELNVPLDSGDLVHVPRSGVFFIDGAVEGPGYFNLQERTTLAQAISMAKGLKYEARKDLIRIYRDHGKDERELIIADYEAILKGLDKDIEIEDRDIIIVPKNGFRDFVKGLKGSLNLGIFSIGKNY
jgi:polysaccharide export outer membrane protein